MGGGGRRGGGEGSSPNFSKFENYYLEDKKLKEHFTNTKINVIL